jgi:hypothetical protein
VRLLADLHDLFATTTADRVATAAIIRGLTALEDRPWADYAQGQPLTPRHLATLLEAFRIRAKQIRQGAGTRKGYMRADFADAFRRYLPLNPTCATQRDGNGAFTIENGARPSAAVSEGGPPPRREHPSTVSDVSDVSDAPAEDRGASSA